MSLITAALTAIAQAVFGFALFQFCRERHAPRRGPLRWLVVVGVALIALIGFANVLAYGFHARVMAQRLGELAACGELLAAMLLLSFLQHARRRVVAPAGRKIRRRTARANAQADAAYALLSLAERHARFGHWHLTPDGVFSWSEQMFEIFGQLEDTATDAAQTLRRFHPQDREIVARQLAAAATCSEEFEINARFCRPDGEERHLLLSFSGFADGSVAGIAFDRTNERVAEARLAEAQEMLLCARAQLRACTTVDELTGLANRQTFETSLVRETKRAVRANQPLSLILLDVDRLSHFNRTYTQANGDDCLRRVGEALRATPRRDGDALARLGGGTFALLLPLAEAKGAYRITEGLRATIESMAIPHVGTEPAVVTLSAGISSIQGAQDVYAGGQLLHRAQAALLAAKRQGGDRVAVFDTLPFKLQNAAALHESISACPP